MAGALLATSVHIANAQRVELMNNGAERKVEVSVDGEPFTSYIYPGTDVLRKAVLYPVRTAQGTVVTRGWPMDPRPGERVDHPHHVGVWFNHGDVNGYDFWNSSNAVDRTKHKYGDIVHTGITNLKSGKGKGELNVTADWVSQDGDTFLKEKTTYIFRATGDERIIDRITTLTAQEDVTFNDSKEGMFGMRLARQLELPSKKAEVFTDANGVATKVATLNNDGVTGNYRNKEGVEGDDVWGKRSAWNDLSGKIGNEDISVVIFDHPQNVGYPAYWHARGYGLFAVNPMGDKEYSEGKETRNHKLSKGQSMTLRYRLVVASHHLTEPEKNKLAGEFSKVK
ncbi:hypothetical protein GCM10007390_26970 [Persicitalea jodogahamensis]|uniref:Methane oxygenase PmoA n=2 Tax=Persicitalea jodogahamensis TaxID=402147 RepID=A0A8J3D7C8_9BACT|nr:hypothetical protein GCM10007390_26970 [Persicitalea jodogahamensis]